MANIPKPTGLGVTTRKSSEFARFAINVDQDESENVSFSNLAGRLFLQPVWLCSFAVHLAVLLLLAAWVLPRIGDDTIFMLAQQQPQVDLEEPETVVLEINTPDQLFDIEIPQEELEPLNELDEHQLIDEIAGEPDEFGFEGELVEHNAEVADVMANEGTEGNPDALQNQQAAAGIQQQVVAAGGQSGEVQFSLVWKTKSDLDLHVVAPDGERIHYLYRQSRCRGRLDVDRNANADFLTDEPVENVRWLRRGKPKEGRYTVMIHLFEFRGLIPRIAYDLMAKTGDDIDIQSTHISFANRIHVFRYVYIPGNVAARYRMKRIEKYRELQEREERLATTLLEKIERGSANEVDRLWAIVKKYPHTDAAIEALRRIGNSRKK